MTKRIVGTFALLTLVAGISPAGAQVAWESPFLVVPGDRGGLGIYLLEPDPGDELGAVVTWGSRSSPGPFDLGFRAGIAEGYDDDVAVSGGVDASDYLLRTSDEVPVDLIWAVGAGLSIGDHVMVGFPGTLVVGRSFEAEGIRITPFAGLRVSLDAHLGRDRPGPRDDDDVDLNVSADLGFDLAFSPRWVVRFAASVGDRDALAVGLRIPAGGS